MHQMTQQLKSGAVKVIEVPAPMLQEGMVLVRNAFSLISTGTESRSVSVARKSLLGKALERPEQARLVMESLRRQGPVATYRAVMKRLDAFGPLGYSSAGVVLEAGPGVSGYRAGDPVACGGGGYAVHAEIVAVPVNLCIRLQAGADLAKAAYTTLGAVALQGVRQADLRVGETCVVIGLGLIGRLTGMILRASGIGVAGIDLDPFRVEAARPGAIDIGLPRDAPGLEGRIVEWAGGIGADAVIITASSDSRDPIQLAGRLCRKRGRVVLVGDVATEFDREVFYRKELDLRLSCSYGPGRYDPSYEEMGRDYPAAYVRWTENRNMKAFWDLVASGRIDPAGLTSRIFSLEEAPAAFDLILEKKAPVFGLLIRYAEEAAPEPPRVSLRPTASDGVVNIGFIGAGSYAAGFLLPHLPKGRAFVRRTILSAHGTSSRGAAERFGFESCTSDESDLMTGGGVDTLFISTRHDSHAGYVLKGLRAGRRVFVEKPLCLDESELREIEGAYAARARDESLPVPPVLMVGFNRRFAPLGEALKKSFGGAPEAMIYRVNAGPLPADSWIRDPVRGGGRIVGEVCHFVDFLTYLAGSFPVSVRAEAASPAPGAEGTVTATLRFANGALGTIVFLTGGSKSLFKEHVEAHGGGTSAILRDFRSLRIWAGGRMIRKRLWSPDKGQARMVAGFCRSLERGEAAPIPFEEIAAVTRATLRIEESIRTGRSLDV